MFQVQQIVKAIYDRKKSELWNRCMLETARMIQKALECTLNVFEFQLRCIKNPQKFTAFKR